MFATHGGLVEARHAESVGRSQSSHKNRQVVIPASSFVKASSNAYQCKPPHAHKSDAMHAEIGICRQICSPREIGKTCTVVAGAEPIHTVAAAAAAVVVRVPRHETPVAPPLPVRKSWREVATKSKTRKHLRGKERIDNRV